jgi:hypothetical protein
MIRSAHALLSTTVQNNISPLCAHIMSSVHGANTAANIFLLISEYLLCRPVAQTKL